jgi:hypothetical protein
MKGREALEGSRETTTQYQISALAIQLTLDVDGLS